MSTECCCLILLLMLIKIVTSFILSLIWLSYSSGEQMLVTGYWQSCKSSDFLCLPVYNILLELLQTWHPCWIIFKNYDSDTHRHISKKVNT